MDQVDILALFSAYKQSCWQRLNKCETIEMKEAVLEVELSQLLEQNELLLKTIIDLQKEAKNRSIEMEKRLNISASRTEEVVLAMNKYEKDIKKIVSERVFQVDASQVIDELNSHILALNVENCFLREQNDNLKHDLNNLIEMVKRRNDIGGNESQDGTSSKTECLTFCDVLPEDIFGPIETIMSSSSDNHEVVQPEHQLESESRTLSRASSASNNNPNKHIIEEKELLICKLQEHLQTISKQLELKDEVVKNLEVKLNSSRKDNSLIKSELSDLKVKYDDKCGELKELAQRIDVLNEHKRSLMTQLDQESEERIRFKQELQLLNARLEESVKTVIEQSVTITHLREAIVTRSKADATQVNGISISSSTSQAQDL